MRVTTDISSSLFALGVVGCSGGSPMWHDLGQRRRSPLARPKHFRHPTAASPEVRSPPKGRSLRPQVDGQWKRLVHFSACVCSPLAHAAGSPFSGA